MEKHKWKPGDVFIHGWSVYVYVEERHGIYNIRLRDGGDVVAVAAENWSDDPDAQFVFNIQSVFNEIEKLALENVK